jgi:hypothetical protein
MGTPSIAVPTIVSQRTAYVPQQPIVVPISPPVFVQTVQPIIRTIPSRIIVRSILQHIFDVLALKKTVEYSTIRSFIFLYFFNDVQN